METVNVGGALLEVQNRFLDNTTRLNQKSHIKPEKKYQFGMDENKFEFMRNVELFHRGASDYRIKGELSPNGNLTQIEYTIIPRAELFIFKLIGLAMIVLGIIGLLVYWYPESVVLVTLGVIPILFGQYYINKTNEMANMEFSEFIRNTRS